MSGLETLLFSLRYGGHPGRQMGGLRSKVSVQIGPMMAERLDR